jgi:phage terminase large subunit
MSTWPGLKQIISEWGLNDLFKTNETEMKAICPHNGNCIAFAGLDDVEKLKSITFENGPLTDIWIEEASEIREDDFKQLNLRLRGDNAKQPFQITMSFNPVSSQSWLKRVFFDTQKDGLTILKTTYKDNEFIDTGYKKELEDLKNADPVFYSVYALGDWGHAGDLVFRNVDFKPCKYKYEDFDSVHAGMDFGFNHYHAITLTGIKDGELWTFRELYCRQRTNDEIIRLNENEGVLSKDQPVTCDSAEPKSIQDWKYAGYNVRSAKKGPDSVFKQLNFLNSKKWHIDPTLCPGLASEVKGYAWRKDKYGNTLDEPIAINDDSIASVRYALEHMMNQKDLAFLF